MVEHSTLLDTTIPLPSSANIPAAHKLLLDDLKIALKNESGFVEANFMSGPEPLLSFKIVGDTQQQAVLCGKIEYFTKGWFIMTEHVDRVLNIAFDPSR